MPSHVEMNRQRMSTALMTAAGRWCNQVGREVTNNAKARCPVDEGALRSSIDYTTAVDAQKAHVTIGSPLPYAEFVHRGTGIYGPNQTPIVPTTAKALKFRWEPTSGGGRPTKSKDKRAFYFFASVKGQPAQPFLADALRAVMGAITSTFDSN